MYEYRKMTPEERQIVLDERRARGFPYHATPHFKGIEGKYLITAACFEHKPIFDSPDLLSLLKDELLSRLSECVQCEAWVFLPNHYHISLEAPDLAIISDVLRKGHSKIATKVNGLHSQRGRKVWYRYTDRMIRNEAHYWATINYIHYNPVKHGYVDKMSDWPWSSVHEYYETMGERKLRELWGNYPVKDYGKGWDW